MSHMGRVVVLLALGCGLAACDAEDKPAQPQPFTEQLARKLLPEAASMDPVVLHTIVELGAKISARDIEQHASLTALMLTLRISSWPPEPRDVQISPKATPADLVKVLYRGKMPSKPDPARRPTLLNADTITSVSVDQDGDTAKGVVQFTCGSVMSGQVQYEARRIDGSWSITAFALPKRGARLERAGDAWRLEAKPVESVPVDLSVVDALGVAPPEKRVTVSLTADGTAHLGGSSFGFSADDPVAADTAVQALRAELAKRVEGGTREPDRASTVDFVLVADGAAKWKYAQWILQMAAAEGVYRVHFAVQPRAAKEATVLKAFLPKDSGLAATPELPPDSAPIKVKLFRRNLQSHPGERYTLVKIDSTHAFHLPKGWRTEEQSLSAPAEYLAVMEKVRAVVQTKFQAGGKQGEIITPPPKGGSVPCEDILNVLAIMQGIGMEGVTFEGQTLPLTRREREMRRNK